MNPIVETIIESSEVTTTPTARGRVRWLLVALVLAGVCFDLVLRSSIASAAGTGALLSVTAALVLDDGVRSRVGWAMVATAAVFAALLAVRASPWLFPLNTMAAMGLLVLVAGGAADAGPAAPPLRVLRRCVLVLAGLVWAPAFVMDRLVVAFPWSSGPARDHARSIGRGIGLAVPLLAVLGGLLASADAMFASFFDLQIDGAEWVLRLVVVLVGIWLASALLWLATDRMAPELWVGEDRPRPLGAIESGLVLAALVGLYALFVVAQGLAAGASEAHVLRTTGLTRAEYARTGFFQLLWAAGITLGALLGIHRFTDAAVVHRRWMRALNLGAVVLMLVVVGVAIRRLSLYEDAYGLTMLRLYSWIFAWWLGAVFVAVGVYLLRPWRRQWWAASLVSTALVTLLAVNLVGPERLVVDRNVARVAAGQPLDASYLADLSDDAVPALVAAAARLEGPDRDRVIRAACVIGSDEPRSWYGFNAAVHRAERARASICR